MWLELISLERVLKFSIHKKEEKKNSSSDLNSNLRDERVKQKIEMNRDLSREAWSSLMNSIIIEWSA